MKMYKSFAILLTIWISLIAPAHAGWTEDVRLTHRNFEMEPQVVARNDTVHIAWQQYAWPDHICYIRSTDGGNIWSEVINLQDTANHYEVRQDLWLTPDYVFVGWQDGTRPGFITNIGYTYSTDGEIWEPPGYVFPNGRRFFDLGTAAFRDSIYAVYFSEEQDSTGAHLFKFLYSSDMGITWSNEVAVGHADEYTNFLHMAHCRNSLYIVWASDMPPLGGIREVMAVVSHDGGQSWSDVIQLSSPNTAVAQLTCVACDEESGNFAVGWMDAGDLHHYPGDLYVRITTDGGYTWMPESHASYNRWVLGSSIAIKGDSLWAVWDDRDPAYGQGNSEVCFSYSTNLGTSWSPYERLTYEPERSFDTWIGYDSGKLHVVWNNENPLPEDGRDIYYKRFEPETGIDGGVDRNLPDRITLMAYPNPFNSSVTIDYSNLQGGEVNIYDIQGKLVRIFSLEGGENGKINWDATDNSGRRVSSGIYFVRVSTPRYNKAAKLLYLR